MKTDRPQNTRLNDTNFFLVTCLLWTLIVLPDCFGYGSNLIISQWLRAAISIPVTGACVALALANRIAIGEKILLCLMASYILLMLWQTIAG